MGLAKAWALPGNSIVSKHHAENNMCVQIEEVCCQRIRMTRSTDSIRVKLGTLQRDEDIWITCGGRVEVKAGTGNWCEYKKRKMNQALCSESREWENRKIPHADVV